LSLSLPRRNEEFWQLSLEPRGDSHFSFMGTAERAMKTNGDKKAAKHRASLRLTRQHTTRYFFVADQSHRHITGASRISRTRWEKGEESSSAQQSREIKVLVSARGRKYNKSLVFIQMNAICLIFLQSPSRALS